MTNMAHNRTSRKSATPTTATSRSFFPVVIAAKYAGTCPRCKKQYAKGTKIRKDPALDRWAHDVCLSTGRKKKAKPARRRPVPKWPSTLTANTGYGGKPYVARPPMIGGRMT